MAMCVVNSWWIRIRLKRLHSIESIKLFTREFSFQIGCSYSWVNVQFFSIPMYLYNVHILLFATSTMFGEILQVIHFVHRLSCDLIQCTRLHFNKSLAGIDFNISKRHRNTLVAVVLDKYLFSDKFKTIQRQWQRVRMYSLSMCPHRHSVAKKKWLHIYYVPFCVMHSTTYTVQCSSDHL